MSKRLIRQRLAKLRAIPLFAACDDLERFRQSADNLYERVRASIFLHALYRYSVQDSPGISDAESCCPVRRSTIWIRDALVLALVGPNRASARASSPTSA